MLPTSSSRRIDLRMYASVCDRCARSDRPIRPVAAGWVRGGTLNVGLLVLEEQDWRGAQSSSLQRCPLGEVQTRVPRLEDHILSRAHLQRFPQYLRGDAV